MPAIVIAAFANDLNRRAASLDGAVVLLDEVVQILVRPNLHVAPARVFASQQPQRASTRHVAVERHFAGHTRKRRGKRLTKERLCGRDAAVAAQKEVDGLAMLVNGAVQVMPLRFDRDVDPPRGADRFGDAAPSFHELRDVAGNPAKDRRMRDLDAALGHHLNQVPVGDIPTHAQLNDVGIKRALAIDSVTVNRLRHPTPRQTIRQSTRCPWMHQIRPSRGRALGRGERACRIWQLLSRGPPGHYNNERTS